MDTVFIVNPKAGQGKNIKSLIEKIKASGAKHFVTGAVGDAERFVRDYCSKNGAARFIACGGDGTFSDVLNGISRTPDAEIGVLPIGTGNDFCRNFDGNFSDISAQINGTVLMCDAIRYTTRENSRLCANMINIGFDCNVADLASELKKKPLISGSLAYFLAILITLIKKKGADIKIALDEKSVYDGPLLLTALANGKFCGGGIMSNPLSSVKDGLIDINMIYNVSRLKFIALLPYYMKGTHLKLKNIHKVILNTKCKKVSLTPNGGALRICVDGEIFNADAIDFEIVPKAFKFVVANKKGM